MIDTDFLVRVLPDLDAVRRDIGSWNAFGEKISEQMERDWAARHRSGEPLWVRAKRAVHRAITGNDANHSVIRARIHRSPGISAMMLADLDLWLAGDLGISISVTKRLVAVMLIGLAEAEGDWDVLNE